jgi:hypothetical protein
MEIRSCLGRISNLPDRLDRSKGQQLFPIPSFTSSTTTPKKRSRLWKENKPPDQINNEIYHLMIICFGIHPQGSCHEEQETD